MKFYSYEFTFFRSSSVRILLENYNLINCSHRLSRRWCHKNFKSFFNGILITFHVVVDVVEVIDRCSGVHAILVLKLSRDKFYIYTSFISIRIFAFDFHKWGPSLDDMEILIDLRQSILKQFHCSCDRFCHKFTCLFRFVASFNSNENDDKRQRGKGRLNLINNELNSITLPFFVLVLITLNHFLFKVCWNEYIFLKC